LTSAVFAAVEIFPDPQAGHVDGASGRSALESRSTLLRHATVMRFSVGLSHHFSGGDLQLRGDGDFVSARHPRRAAAGELPRTKTSQDRELERGESHRTLYHHDHPFVTRRAALDHANRE
jgi:hypothetical protein